jgi:ABC-type glycerol-3-phosphate transport system permease component
MKPTSTAHVGRGLIYILLSFSALITLTPLVWLVLATVKPSDQIFGGPFFPKLHSLTLGNYHDLFTTVPFFQYFVNSTFVACTTVLVQLFFASLGGFALAKYNFKGRKAVMVLMLATMMIPGQVLLAPTYELIYRMHLVDSYLGLIVPSAVNVFGMFLFRQSILQVPDEIIHAARIDGCSEFRIYWDIVMPVSRPMIGAFCLTTFMGNWNSFLWPQIILHADEHSTLPIALAQMINLYQQQYGMLMAGTFVSILPLFVLFMLLQKEFVAGLTAGAVKG